MKTNLIAIAALAALLLASAALAGCTSSKYVPCCVRDGIFGPDGEPRSTPACTFQNGTLFGACVVAEDEKNVAFCTDGKTLCESIEDESECVRAYNCGWNYAGSPPCTSTSLGAFAYWPLPVCTDRAPKQCTNDQCSAMICGYDDIRPAPPPASKDWDAEAAAAQFEGSQEALPQAAPANDIMMPSIGLQGTTCDVVPMSKKNYNKIKASRGALWVNSFRFGVGNSFSDFESARNYFPATDKVCAANPYAQIDRFTVYVGQSTTYCKGSSTYYVCSGPKFSGMAFKDETSCKLYCGGGVAPYSCNQVVGGIEKFICNQDGFAYETEDGCKLKCSIIDDPNACANDETKFPFLDTDSTSSARYRMKYISDYMVDSNSPISEWSYTCVMHGGPQGQYSFPYWRIGTPELATACNDYRGSPGTGWYDGPWFDAYDCFVANGVNSPKCTSGNVLGELRTYFDNHAYTALDFDYDYYAKKLLEQYTDTSSRLPFECESSADCMSGSCDTTYYKRPMCTDTDGNTVWCSCSKQEFGSEQVPYPSCNLLPPDSTPIYADSAINDEYVNRPIAEPLYNNDAVFHPADSMHVSGDVTKPTLKFRYYALAPSGASSPKPELFVKCGVEPKEPQPVKKCIMQDLYEYDPYGGDPVRMETDEPIIKNPESDGKCHYAYDEIGYNSFDAPYYWLYEFNLNESDLSKQVNVEKFGSCALNGKNEGGSITEPSAPYLKMKDLGWCAGCTYATLAVQKVEWGQDNPGGVGTPRPYSCYEYRADFNYVPGQYPYGGFVGDAPSTLYSGNLRWNQDMAKPSTEPVRRTSNPSAYMYDQDGNLVQGSNQPCNDDTCYSYLCKDGWNGNGGWWRKGQIPTPSAPYLKEKLTSYLQSNVMPILDEISTKTTASSPVGCENLFSPAPYHCNDPNDYYTNIITCADACFGTCNDEVSMEEWTCPVDGKLYPRFRYGEDPEAAYQACAAGCFQGASTGSYAPLSICKDMGGDGAVLHVVGNTAMLNQVVGSGDYGWVTPISLGSELQGYMGISGSSSVQFLENDINGGKNAILARTSYLEQGCQTPPLVGIEILPNEDETTLIINPSTGVRGSLSRFFFKDTWPGYEQRVARGLPDKYPGQVDMLMQDWYPMCDWGGKLPGENEVYEFERRLELSRALLGNFSTPSLIWKFAFPTETRCDKAFFLDYMFNHTADMVDVGITGVIYSDWSVEGGLGYGPESRYYSDTASYPGSTHSWTGYIDTGLTTETTTARAPLSVSTQPLDHPTLGKTSLFCALEKYSKRAIGYISLTYGQKLYAENVTCYCEQCTDYDFAIGACDMDAPNQATIPQLYCNDGTRCKVPAGAGTIDYSEYKCPDRCMNYTACLLCGSYQHATDASYCRIADAGGDTIGASKAYSEINDDYWEFLAGLSPSEKCCLLGEGEGKEGTKYTYTAMTGSKQQAEFLQYPTRGQEDVDCGRAPDTSVLTYCNIRVPISQKEIMCMKITKPETPVLILPGGLD